MPVNGLKKKTRRSWVSGRVLFFQSSLIKARRLHMNGALVRIEGGFLDGFCQCRVGVAGADEIFR